MTSQHNMTMAGGGLSPRFTTWVAFFIFSVITLGSSIEIKKSQANPTPAAKWSVTCSIVTVCVATLLVLAHFTRRVSAIVIGTRVEGAIIGILVVLWASIVSIVTDTSNNLAVVAIDTTTGRADPTAAVALNGNLYYFSWAGFVTSVLLLMSYLRQACGVDVVGQVRHRAARLPLWAALLASALVVMGSSARVHREQACSDGGSVADGGEFCTRTSFAVAVGAIGVALSLGAVGLKLLLASPPFAVEFGLAAFLCALNAFGVSYITSPQGPGSNIGNLYYFSWASFLCSAMLLADCCEHHSERRALQAIAEAERNSGLNLKGDIPIEECDTFDTAESA